MAKNENSNFSYMIRRIGGTTYKVKVVFSDTAVSYTHLDVYKRQILFNSSLSIPKLNNCNRPNSGKLITDLPLFFYPKADSQAINDISLSRTVGTELVPNA